MTFRLSLIYIIFFFKQSGFVKLMKAVIKSSSNLIPASPTTITKEPHRPSEIKALRQNTAVEVRAVWNVLLPPVYTLSFRFVLLLFV